MKNISNLINKPYAHRGIFDNKSVPENSIKAFEIALNRNYNIELDVHLTRDKKIVVFHDHSLKRMCRINKRIEDCDYSELKKYKLLNTEYFIPLLIDVLKIINGKVNVLIETKIKKYNGILEYELSKILDKYNGIFLLQSFNYLSINWFKKHKSNYIVGVLASAFKGKKINPIYKIISKTLIFDKVLKADFISYDIRNLPNKYVLRKRKEKPILGWTVKKDIELKSFTKYCDCLICEFDIIANLK